LPVVVFPHPLSPAKPRELPRTILKLTPSTAFKILLDPDFNCIDIGEYAQIGKN